MENWNVLGDVSGLFTTFWIVKGDTYAILWGILLINTKNQKSKFAKILLRSSPANVDLLILYLTADNSTFPLHSPHIFFLWCTYSKMIHSFRPTEYTFYPRPPFPRHFFHNRDCRDYSHRPRFLSPPLDKSLLSSRVTNPNNRCCWKLRIRAGNFLYQSWRLLFGNRRNKIPGFWFALRAGSLAEWLIEIRPQMLLLYNIGASLYTYIYTRKNRFAFENMDRIVSGNVLGIYSSSNGFSLIFVLLSMMHISRPVAFPTVGLIYSLVHKYALRLMGYY